MDTNVPVKASFRWLYTYVNQMDVINETEIR